VGNLVRSRSLRKRLVLGLAAAFFIRLGDVLGANDKVPSEVFNQAATAGKVLVLVGLNVPWSMEGTLADNEVVAQRRAIGSAQRDLLSELAGTEYKIVRVYDVIPGMALEVGNEALAVLKNSGSVTNVLPDRPIKPAANAGMSDVAPTTSGNEGTANVGSVPTELFLEATSSGAVLVLVGLKTPWSPEGPLSEEMMLAQRQGIAAAQNYLLTELANTEYRITRRYQAIPGIALEVGLDALRVLAHSVAVTNVLRDRPAISTK